MDCVFCKIVQGEIPAYVIYEDEKTLAFLDAHPVATGHALVIPKAAGSQSLLDISAGDWAAVSESARKVSAAIVEGLKADGINLMMNNGKAAGQVVPHPHVHLVPRFEGDGLKHWPPGTFDKSKAAETLARIKARL